MSHDLFDLKRLKVTDTTRRYLSAKAHRTGKSQQEIAREILHEKALAEFEDARFMRAFDSSEGQGGAVEGSVRDARGRRR